MRDKKLLLKLFTVLAAVMVIFAACGEDETADTGDDGDTGGGAGDFILVNEGRLTVGSDIPYPPFEMEEGGELTGFDYDIVTEVASRIGLENAAEDWLSVNFDTIFQQLAAGQKFDVVAAAVTGYAPEGSPASETVAERTKVVDFTVPYYPSLQSLTVDTGESDVTTVEDLPDGARVGVQRATTGAFYAEEELTPLGVELVQFPKAPEMYQQLAAGNIDAIFNDLPVSLAEIEKFPGLEVVQQVETGEEYAIAVSKENTALKDAIDGALQEMFEDGTYAEIFEKYFPEQDLPSYASA